jgi:hypothetical protein
VRRKEEPEEPVSASGSREPKTRGRIDWRESSQKNTDQLLSASAQNKNELNFPAVCTMFGDKAYDLIRELERTGPDTLPLYNVSILFH